MANTRNLCHLLLLFSLLQFTLISTLSSALFSPPDNHLLSCGACSSSTLDDRRVFLPDSDPKSARLLCRGRSISVSAATNPSPAASPLSETARVFTHSASYDFPIKEKGTHLVRLHFYPFPAKDFDLAAAQFHVSASEFVLLSDFGTSAPLLKEFLIWVDAEKLEITFTPAKKSSFAFINAIEVVSAPRDLVGDVARLVKPDRIENLDGLSKQVFETLYRMNVGGPKVTPFNDTLWRTWIPDDGYLRSGSASKSVYFSSRIMYQQGGASREVAPDNVYNTARVVDGAKASASNSNMTWEFPVISGYRYLIRMHFCDIASLALNQLYFNVYVNGYLAYEDFDLSEATGGLLASPHYVDFVVDVKSSGILTVGIGPSKHSFPLKIDGLLNGLEIMKINNTEGSFNGETPIILVLESPVRRGFGVFIRSLVCGFAFMGLLVIGFVLLLKWRAESRNHVAWAPLPMDASDVQLGKANQMVSGK